MKIISRIEGSLCGAPPLHRQGFWSSIRIGHGHRTVHGCQARARLLQQDKAPRDGPKSRRAEPEFFTPWIPPPAFYTPWISPPAPVKAVSSTLGAGDGTSGFSTTPITKQCSPSDTENEDGQKDSEKTSKTLPLGFFQNKQELLSLVDQSQDGSLDEHINFTRDPYMRGYSSPDGPHLTVSELADDKDFPSFSQVREGDDIVQRTVSKLWRAIHRRLRNPHKTDIGYIYGLYQSLPHPHMPYLHSRIRHDLMRVLGREDKDRPGMLRYFAVVADIQRSGLALTSPEWNAALSFAARYVGHSTETETAEALRLWKEMETDAGVPGNAVTFNILFDVASKAGNFVLAEMLYKEMGKRGFPYNRYHHVSLIHFFGLKQDSDGIRAAYKEMVEAGEMIDTVVLNCVIAGFLRCGEEYAAERVYERMKAAHERAPEMPYRNYMNNRVITKALMMFAQISKDSAENSIGENGAQEGDGGALRRHFQKISPIVPDIQTYRILLNHYAVRMSALDKVVHFLDDMKWFQIPLHGAIFLALFKGFANYGGRGQQWSPQRLENVWKAFNSALEENANGLYVDVWMAKWILRAFRKCQTEQKTWQVWAELRPRCETDFDPEDVEHFEAFLFELFQGNNNTRIVKDEGMFGKTERQW